MSILEFLAGRLKELRLRHGLTQEQVAILLGTDLRWYQRIEAKSKDIRASTIDRLAEVFGVSAAELLAKEMPETKVRNAPQAPHRPRKPTKRKAKTGK